MRGPPAPARRPAGFPSARSTDRAKRT
jgi:hypothetical protein